MSSNSKFIKVAVVTGASQGIGKALCMRLLSENWKVIMIARSIDKLKNIQTHSSKSDNCIIIGCDLSNEQSTMKCIQQILDMKLTIHLLVNNAGAALFRKNSLEECDLASWNWHHNLLLKAPFLFTKYLFPSFNYKSDVSVKLREISEHVTKNYTTIINIGSTAGIQANASQMVYGVHKAALAHLTKLNAVELGKYGIRVNCIQLGNVYHEGVHEKLVGEMGIGDRRIASWNDMMVKECYPIGRLGTANDVVEFIMFLTDGRKSGWITGECIVMDGGQSIFMHLPSAAKL